MSDTVLDIFLIMLAVVALLVLSWVRGDSQRRFIHATDDLVTTGLIREREEQELRIEHESFQHRLTAVRDCENRIYGYLPSSGHPEQLRAAVGPLQAREHLGTLLASCAGAERHAAEQHAELERHLAEKRVRIQADNRGFRKVDRILGVSAETIRICLLLAVLYAFTSLLFGLFQ